MKTVPLRRRGPGRWLGLALLLVAFALLAPYLVSGTELVRLRHALVMGPDFQAAQDWSPPAVPPGYRQETAPPDPYFVAVAERLGLAALPDDWARGVAIATHLLSSHPPLLGGPVHDDLKATHRAIVERGQGYCGDFVRAFTAIAQAAGMTVRRWSFSFDGFGGHGHIWAEVWNRDRARWQLLDVYQNYWFSDGAGEPLSALQFKRALEARSPTLRLHPIHAASAPGWAEEAKAWDYFRRGLPQWYLTWGDNAFGYDAMPPVQWFAGRSRVLEQLSAIAFGVHPPVRVLAEAANAAERSALRALRVKLWICAALGVAGLVLLAWAPRRRQLTEGSPDWPRVALVGPLPPPSGGMANQCEQLLRLLRTEGAIVEHVRTNAPLVPAALDRVPVLRAGLRLVPYVVRLWSALGRADVMHLFANSGWAWHLLAAPALLIARWRGVPAIVNYRGGQAEEFLARAPGHVLRSLRGAALRVTPSSFLQRVFARHGLATEIVPNIVDLTRFTPRPARTPGDAPHLIVTRNLEAIYDVPTALRAFARVRRELAHATLTVAGSGPERAALESLARELGIDGAVRFSGRIDNAAIGALYASADLMLNPSTADNMPISILEALASGVPVVSTDAGGIPDLVEQGRTALLVKVGDAAAMADAALSLLREPARAEALRAAGLEEAARYAWPRVREQWRDAYRRAAAQRRGIPVPAGTVRSA